jgi:hypothetical protein
VALEKLHLALMPLGGLQRLKRSQIPSLPGSGIALARIKPITASSKFSYHKIHRNIFSYPVLSRAF